MNIKKGFTLIELLVAISIIGLLSSIVLINIQSAQEKAKVAKAKVEMRQIMLAAELVNSIYNFYPNDSHGSIVCPKDIVLDTNTGKKWGDYIEVCNDPWGNPYEWNNFCDIGQPLDLDNTPRRAPHPPYTTGCDSYSATSQGSIGVMVAGKNATIDKCNDDDICYGEKGFPQFGWTSSDVAYVPPSAPEDTTPPSTPTLSGSAPDWTAVNLSWTAATDNVGVTGYKVFRDSSQIATISNTSYSDTGVTGGSSYTYTVKAYDAAGNLSTNSNTININVPVAPPPPDTTPPSTPTLSGSAPDWTAVNLSWTAATDNVGVTGYKVFRDSSQIATISNTSYSDTGVTGGSSYTYTVKAYDAAGNLSTNSNTINISVPLPPPVQSCTTSIGSCSGLTTAECSSRTGCSVSSSSCSGSYSASCSSFNQSSCTPSGCSWISSGSCGGTVSCSVYASNQTSCTTSGCSYTAASCRGSAACNQWNGTNSTTCTSGHTGCTWSNGGGGKCNGTLACSTLSQSSCTPIGCSWGASSCSGTPSCSAFGQSQCTGTTGCTWTTSGSCQGSYSSACSAYSSNQTTCQATSGCTWSASACTGTAASCSSFSSQNSCMPQAGCLWQ